MSSVIAKQYLKEKGFEGKITVHSGSIDTVEHAAQQIGCSEAEIAKTLSFLVDGNPVIIVMAGDEFTSVALTIEELERSVDLTGWCDVCKGWEIK